MAKIYRFDFKKLVVYHAATEYFGWAARAARRLPWQYRRVTDQIIGSALSVLGNIGESGGRIERPREASQHFRYAQGSAHESAAYLDALDRLGAISEQDDNQKESELADIGAMLTRLIQHQDRMAREPRWRP